MSESSGNSEPGQSVWRRYRWHWLAAALILVVSLVLVLLPYGLKWGLTRWLIDRGAESAQVADVDFNPFTGRLVVKGLSAECSQVGRLKFERAEARIDWWPLWKRRIHLQSISLINSSFNLIMTDDGTLTVGPLVFPPQEKKPESTNEPWAFGVEGIALKEIDVHYSGPFLERALDIREFNTDALVSWRPETLSRFKLQVAVGDGVIRLDGQSRPFSKDRPLQTEVKIDAFPLDWLAPLLQRRGFKGLSATLGGDIRVRFGLQEGPGGGPHLDIDGALRLSGIRVHSETLQLRDGSLGWQGLLQWNGKGRGDKPLVALEGQAVAGEVDLEFPAAKLRWRQGKLSVEGTLAYRDDPGSPGLKADVATKASDLHIDDLKKKGRLLEVAKVELPSLTVDGPGRIRAGNLSLAGLKAFERSSPEEVSNDSSFILALRELTVKGSRLDDLKRLAVSEISLDGLQALLLRRENGAMELSRWLGNGKTAVETERKGEQKGEKEKFLFSAARIEVGGKSRLVFEDRSVTPVFRHSLDPLSIKIEKLDGTRPQQQSPIVIKAQQGKYASLELTGNIRPFAEKAGMSLTGTLKSLELPPFSSYSRKFIGYRLESGQLNADLDWSLEKGQLNARSKLRLAKLSVEPLSREEESGEMTRRLGMPLKSALSMLRDKNDNIELELTVTGNPADPSFKVGEIVMTVLVKAIKKGLVTYYAPMGLSMLTGAAVPLGATYVAGKLFDLVTALRFEPLLFEPGEAGIAPDAAGRLEKMAELLKDRPGVRLVLCGKAVPGDFRPQDREKPSLSEEEKARLLDLARKRAGAVKDYLIKQGIVADRLFICDPGIEQEKDARPRVEIAI